MKALYAALLKAAQEFSPVPKDGANPAFRSRYATLGSVQETAFPVLHKHGLVVLQSVRTEWAERGPIVYVGAALVHAESGEMINQEIGLVPVKVDPQGIGSAISYGRRYILLAMLGLTADDDDGNAASGAAQMAPQRSQPIPPPPAKPAPKPAAKDDRLPDEEFQASGDDAPPSETLTKTFHATGTELYGKAWDTKRPQLVKAATGGRSESSKDLTTGEMMRLLDGMGDKLRTQPELITPKSAKRAEFA